MKKAFQTIKENILEFSMLGFGVFCVFVMVGIGLGSWPKAFLVICVFPLLAIASFYVIFVCTVVIALIYGAIFTFLGKEAKYKWWN